MWVTEYTSMPKSSSSFYVLHLTSTVIGQRFTRSAGNISGSVKALRLILPLHQVVAKYGRVFRSISVASLLLSLPLIDQLPMTRIFLLDFGWAL